ncbi:MAG: hypothetical protein KDA87_11200 [Planctomycetales bacterium]|nr:hypothetical protein [Planctomycetales bacterium]
MSFHKNEFVVHDVALLGKFQKPAKLVDELLVHMDSVAEDAGDEYPDFSEVIQSLADLLQGIIHKKFQVDIRKRNAEEVDDRIQAALQVLGHAPEPLATPNAPTQQPDRPLNVISASLNLYQAEIEAHGLSQRSSEILTNVVRELERVNAKWPSAGKARPEVLNPPNAA